MDLHPISSSEDEGDAPPRSSSAHTETKSPPSTTSDYVLQLFSASPVSQTTRNLKRKKTREKLNFVTLCQHVKNSTSPSLQHSNAGSSNEHEGSQSICLKNTSIEGFSSLPAASAPRCDELCSNVAKLSPQDYFHKYIPTDIIQMLTEFTNLRYLRDTGKNLCLSETETKQFIAITIIMSYLKFPRVRMYWSEQTRVPAIADIMSRDRYFLIRNNLKVRDDQIVKDTEKAEDKFWKVRPLLQSVLTGCLANEKSSEVAIDEQIITFYGHSPAKQFIKEKPDPLGLKIFVATAPDGLPLDFFVYQGLLDKINTSMVNNDTKCLDTGGRAVLRLSENLPPGCTLYMDSYFTSVHLLYGLHHRSECHGTGTITDPEDLCKPWSNVDKTYVSVNRPAAAKDTSASLGRVDFLDRVISYYRIQVRTRKWTIKVMMHFLDFSIAASWIEYRSHQKMADTPKKDILDYLAFRGKLQEYLLHVSYDSDTDTLECETGTTKKHKNNAKTAIPLNHCRTKNVLHLPEIPKPATKNRCRMPGCKSNSARIRCTTCKVFLCLQEDRQCYKLFHELKDI